MQPANNSSEEKEILSLSAAAERALQRRGKEDPFAKDIPPSLLSANHIEQYVIETGMIAPFYKGGKKQRLKKASYEGRIGSKAYIFLKETDSPVSILFDSAHPLRVPANSIVFVETDLEFRLPNYIGVRFNLQIRHVHRGLLLGTGPLVDPGYWGKLCIPLHNLTNEDYLIPIEEGLIWVEFTKTTSTPTEGRDALEGDGSQHWDIQDFLIKAARPFAGVGGEPVGIRSSIPVMVDKATTTANDALNSAKQAASQAEAARKNAEDANNTLNRIGIVAGAAIMASVASLYGTFYFGLRADINTVQTTLGDLTTSFGELKGNVIATTQEATGNGKNIEETAKRLKVLEAEVETLHRQGSASDARLPVAASPGTTPNLHAAGPSGGKKSGHSHRPIGRGRR
jgi:deoxycytidine triphosphate deaminase